MTSPIAHQTSGSESTEQIPRHDLLDPLALSLAWHRYRTAKLKGELERAAGGSYMQAVLEHVVRLRRFSEGLTAFGTTGVNEEIMWLYRPALELFASQCILQYCPLKFPSGQFLSNNEKGHSFLSHGLCVQLDLLRKHADYPGAPSRAECDAKKVELEAQLLNSPYGHKPSGEWHGLRSEDAEAVGFSAANEHLKDPELSRLLGWAPKIRYLANKGIHGHAFSGNFLRVPNDSGSIDVVDERTVKFPEKSHFVWCLSKASVEMLADEFGQRSLFKQMVTGAQRNLLNDPSRYIPMFPTTLMHTRL